MKNIITLLLILMNFIFTIDYDTEIQPIFNTNCISCHSYGSNSINNHQLILTSYSGLMAGGESGDVIVSGDSTNSILFQKIYDGSMPPYGSGLNLTAYEISLIAQWIAEGALEVEELSNSNNLYPMEYSLHKPFPNPFNPVTTISYGLPLESDITLNIYDVEGRRITTLTEGIRTAGTHSIEWNAEGYSSGVYFVKLDAGEFTQTQKLMLVK